MPQTCTCARSGKKFTVHDEEIELLKRMGLPLPTLSPEERLRACMASRNEWKLYRRKCDATGESILSAYPPQSPFKVYKNDVWWGDSWDALSYGRNFDFNTPFFKQYAALQTSVPREGTSIFRSENCEFNSHLRDSKNCYLNSLVAKCEDTYYSYWMVEDKDVFDSMYTYYSTLAYECRDAEKCYECAYLEESSNCNECHFGYQLTGCRQCLFCSNLKNKTLHLFNKPCSQEEYNKAKSQVMNGSYRSWLDAVSQYEKIKQNAIHRAVHTVNCENMHGDHFYNSRNCLECFDGNDSEDCANSISLDHSKNVVSAYSAGWPGCEVVYFSAVSRGSQDIAFCRYTWFGNNLRYCDSCVSCKHCFGCIGLRHKDYCILNKQYTKEEYEKLVPKIIEHMRKDGGGDAPNQSLRSGSGPAINPSEASGSWGEFFPSELSPYGYNETAAQDYFPLSAEEARAKGFPWRDQQDEVPNVEKILSATSLPDSIDQVSDDILLSAIQCEKTGKPFRIIKKELEFYRRMRLPIPRVHPMERHRQRMARRNPHQLWQRACAKCAKKMETTYSPDRKEVVYCEECYLKEVY